MVNFNNVIKENIKEHHPNWPQIPDHPYIILITGGSGSGKRNSLFNLINQQHDTDKMFYMLKIYLKQNINFCLTNKEVQA